MRLDSPRFIRNQDVVSRQIGGELIIVPVRRGVGDLNSLYTLNPVGCLLWSFKAEGHTLPEKVAGTSLAPRPGKPLKGGCRSPAAKATFST